MFLEFRFPQHSQNPWQGISFDCHSYYRWIDGWSGIHRTRQKVRVSRWTVNCSFSLSLFLSLFFSLSLSQTHTHAHIVISFQYNYKKQRQLIKKDSFVSKSCQHDISISNHLRSNVYHIYTPEGRPGDF